MSRTIGILGAGSWGATLAALLSDNGNPVTLWEYDSEQAKHLTSWRTLSFFPHLTLPKGVTVTSDLAQAVRQKDILVFVVPSHTMRSVASQVAAFRNDLSETIIVTATKGIENVTLLRMSEILSNEIPGVGNRIVALSGPTHAEEVSQKMPTTATAASLNYDAAQIVQETFITSYFRIYTSSDIIGVETGGALKNIFAIAAGIGDGIGLGDNAKAALVTRGMREMVQLGVKMGGEPSTFFGLTGLGDLIVTCFSRHSRNRLLGEKIGKGRSIDDAAREMVMVAEGVRTAKSAYELGLQYGLELPIVEQVYRVIYENKPPKDALQDLMTREPKPEAKVDIGSLVI